MRAIHVHPIYDCKRASRCQLFGVFVGDVLQVICLTYPSWAARDTRRVYRRPKLAARARPEDNLLAVAVATPPEFKRIPTKERK